MNVLLRTSLISTAIALLGAAPAAAQRIDSPYRFLETTQEANFFVAHVGAQRGSVGLGPENGRAAGVRYAIRMGGPFSIEVEGMYFPTKTAVLDTTVIDSAFVRLGTADRTLVTATAALRLNLTGQRTWHGVQPFLIFGAGAAVQVKSDKAALEAAPIDARYDFGRSLAGSIGGGFAWVPSQRLAIRLDGRNLLWKLKTPAALLRANTGRVNPADEWAQNIVASAGVSILF